MNYYRRKLLHNGFLTILGLSFFKNGFSYLFKNTDMDIKNIGKDSFLINGWIVTKNDLRNL